MRWTEEDSSCLITLRGEGWNSADIANEMGFSKSTIEYWARKLNLITSSRWSLEEDNTLIKLTNDGLTSKECAAILGRNDDAIKTRRVKIGLSKRKGFNGVSADMHSQNELYSKYIDNLPKDVRIVECQGVKGRSLFKCSKCSHEWKARLFDVATKAQSCVVCSNRFASKVCALWLDNLRVSTREHNIISTNYRADGYDVTTNTVYEFLGDFWHGNPEVYNPIEVHPIIGDTYAEVYTKTVVVKFNRLKELGYNICYIWEKDFYGGKNPSYW